MRYLRLALARVRGLFAGRRADDDLREELEAHLEMETAEHDAPRAWTPKSARRQALLASGGLTQAAEAVRDQRGLPWVENAMAPISGTPFAPCAAIPGSRPSSWSPSRSASAPTPRSSASCAACCSSRCPTATATGWSICANRPTGLGGDERALLGPGDTRPPHRRVVVRRHRGVLALVQAMLKGDADVVSIQSASSPATSSTSWASRRCSADSPAERRRPGVPPVMVLTHDSG